MYAISQQWQAITPAVPSFAFRQPWVKRVYEANTVGAGVFSRLWIDEELKKSMGK